MTIEDLTYRLRKRAEIRRQIPSRKSVQENKPDRLANLLEEAADRIKELEAKLNFRYEQEKSGDIKIAEEFRRLEAENQRLQGIITENKERIYRLEKELKEKKSE
jgi:predicted RNase H-like nuclease (RuvC/YqgF family)